MGALPAARAAGLFLVCRGDTAPRLVASSSDETNEWRKTINLKTCRSFGRAGCPSPRRLSPASADSAPADEIKVEVEAAPCPVLPVLPRLTRDHTRLPSTGPGAARPSPQPRGKGPPWRPEGLVLGSAKRELVVTTSFVSGEGSLTAPAPPQKKKTTESSTSPEHRGSQKSRQLSGGRSAEEKIS